MTALSIKVMVMTRRKLFRQAKAVAVDVVRVVDFLLSMAGPEAADPFSCASKKTANASLTIISPCNVGKALVMPKAVPKQNMLL